MLIKRKHPFSKVSYSSFTIHKFLSKKPTQHLFLTTKKITSLTKCDLSFPLSCIPRSANKHQTNYHEYFRSKRDYEVTRF